MWHTACSEHAAPAKGWHVCARIRYWHNNIIPPFDHQQKHSQAARKRDKTEKHNQVVYVGCTTIDATPSLPQHLVRCIPPALPALLITTIWLQIDSSISPCQPPHSTFPFKSIANSRRHSKNIQKTRQTLSKGHVSVPQKKKMGLHAPPQNDCVVRTRDKTLAQLNSNHYPPTHLIHPSNHPALSFTIDHAPAYTPNI